MSQPCNQLEPPTRFSRSLLWQLQRASYQAQGLLAWRPGGVPYQITSNPFIARCHASIVAGLIRDRERAGETRPLQIVELGAGSGRFSYYFLRALTALLEREGGARPAFRLIMTDLPEANLAAWAASPRLRRFVDEGVLDFARFDVERPAPLTLRESGEVLAPDDRGAPVAAIANYLFDSIPHDAYRVDGGQLRECLVALEGPGDRASALLDPASALAAATWQLELAPAEPDVADHADPALREVLAGYASAADGTIVLLPVAGVGAIDYLARLGGGRALIVTADKGYRDPALRADHDDFTVVTHGGCVSMSVDFHALARYCELRGGFALPEGQAFHAFYSGVLAVGLTPAAVPRCLAAVDEVARFGPGDYQRLVDDIAGDARPPSVQLLMGLLRLSGWDPRIVTRFAGAFVDGLRDRAPGVLDRDLLAALEQVLDLHYPLPGRDELLPVLGSLFLHLRRPGRAVVCLERALDGAPDDPTLWLRLAQCWLDLDRRAEAEDCLARALALAPELPPALALARWMAGGDGARPDVVM